MEREGRSKSIFDISAESIKLLQELKQVEPKTNYIDALFRYQNTVLTPLGITLTPEEIKQLAEMNYVAYNEAINPTYTHVVPCDGVDGGYWVFTDHNPKSPYEK